MKPLPCLPHRRSVHVAVALALLALAGCTVGPAYVKPQVDVPAAWRTDYPQATELADARWWEQFGDPVLSDLIASALRANRDLVVAAARVDAFLGALVTTRARFYPQANYGFDAGRYRSSAVATSPLPAGADPYYTLYSGALGASWQLDLFGRVRRQAQAAQAQVYATEQGRRGVVLSVVTSTAAAYIGLRALDRQLEISQRTADNHAHSRRIFELRHKGGVASKQELAQVQSQYLAALAAIPALELQIAAQESLIAVLQGRNPYPVPRGKAIDQLTIPAIPPGLPSALLERRPDILQAEQNVIAANANIGAAQALYFPQFSLTGALGSASMAFGNFLAGPAATWNLVAGIAGPLFTAGSIAGQVQTAQAGRDEAMAVYQQTIFNAFREANDALTGAMRKRAEAAAQEQRVVSLREYARMSRLRFNNGYGSYVDTLYAENELFSAELSAVRSFADQYTQIVNVYKAMGGGWVDAADPGMVGRANPLPDRVDTQQLF